MTLKVGLNGLQYNLQDILNGMLGTLGSEEMTVPIAANPSHSGWSGRFVS